MSDCPLLPSDALKYFNVLGKLKTLKRTGWVNNGKTTWLILSCSYRTSGTEALLFLQKFLYQRVLQTICIGRAIALRL
jgi:hypothetical protein